MKILDHQKINQKIKRIAYEIFERNYDAKKLFLVGINNNGYAFASLLFEQLREICNFEVELIRVKLSPANPLDQPITLSIPPEELDGQSVIFVDDVANSGRTLFYAMKPLFQIIPKRIDVAVLIERMHRTFPIQVDYVGLKLATTLLENIKVNLSGEDYFVELQ